MFKNPFQVAIIFAVVALVVKVGLFSLDMQHGFMQSGIRYVYMLLILLAVFFGIRSNKIMYDGPTTFGQDFRSGARTASFFAILSAIITYVYYSKIDPAFFEIMQQNEIEKVRLGVIEALKEEGKTFKDVRPAAYNKIYGAVLMLAPKFHSLWTMFLLVFTGLFYSAIFSTLMRKFSGFKK